MNDESLTLRVPVTIGQMLSPEERVQFQNFVHTAATNAAKQWLEENFPPKGRTVDLSTLVPQDEARDMFDPDSRSQTIVDEIYKGGTRASIVERVKRHPMFHGEEQYVPNYVSHNMNRLRKDQRV